MATWLEELKRGDLVMILSVGNQPRRAKVWHADEHIIRAGKKTETFLRETGTTADFKYSLAPRPAANSADSGDVGSRVYLATRVRNASTHELTTDQLERLVEILDERQSNSF